MQSKIVLTFILGVVLTYTGCVSTSLQPKPVPLGAHDMVPVRSTEAVGLVNGNSPGFTLIPKGTGQTETDLSKWSYQAVTLIGAWLVKYGVPVDPNAEKKIKVSIVDPRISLKKHLPCTLLTLKIEGKGLEKTYPVEGCAVVTNSAVGYAISYAVIDMMRDRDVTDFIEGR
jgi:hypothetical protein